MRLLHLVGATTTRFYHDLSLTYHAATVTPPGMRADVLRVDPEGGLHLRRADADAERPTDLAAVARLAGECDLVVPFMFCPKGMTVWRELFEAVFRVPVVGPPLSTTVASTSKLQTKALAMLAGVRTPAAHRVTAPGDAPPWSGPCIVKPDSEDNSIGLTLVETADALPPAIERALAHADVALVETYVPGREIRVGVLDVEGRARVLPALEYHVTPDHPIRVRSDKVDVTADGTVTRQSWDAPSLETSCPARIDPATLAGIEGMVLAMHDILGGRDYSLYDLRLHARTGEPYLLEACSFWTFAPMSVLSRMVAAEGADLAQVAEAVFRQTAARR